MENSDEFGQTVLEIKPFGKKTKWLLKEKQGLSIHCKFVS